LVPLAAARVETGGRPVPVLIRATVGIEAHTHEFIATAHEDQKFGFSLATGDALTAAVRVIREPHLELTGLHSHIGSQIFDTAGFEAAAHRVVGLLGQLRQATGKVLAELNLGGGFGIAYLPDDDPVAPRDIAARLRAVVAAECAEQDLPVPRLAVEPGRAIAGPGTVTLYEVGTIKPVRLGASGAPGTPHVRNYVSVDGGMSDNIRTALYDASYTCVLANRTSDAPPALCRVVGKHCESGDILVRDLWLPSDVQPGDLLAVAATGAYCWSMASNYNYLLKPPVVAVRNGVDTEIVRRQTLSDVFALDAVLAGTPAPSPAPSQPAPEHPVGARP
jgi:diaminopimelate decarboxylase